MAIPRTRGVLEISEQNSVAPYALTSAASLGREHSEPESASRTAFQRDRDRVLHTTAFRRLEYKTQVFVFHEGDHYRTRLTHTLEVAQLGRSIARGLGANEDLTEAICLAHDLGHPPFGHAGEEALNGLMAGLGGFNHNTQSFRVVTFLEQAYPGFDGINLTYETREGMIKHETEYDKSDAAGFAPERQASLEAQIANMADEIAYNAHDLEDGLRAGLFVPEDLAHLEIWQKLADDIGWKGGQLEELTRRHFIRELIGLMVMDVVAHTARRLLASKVNSANDLQFLPDKIAGYSEGMRDWTRPLKDFLYERMYRHHRLVRMQAKAERFVEQIFTAYIEEPDMLPAKTRQQLDSAPAERVVTDYIAGMTDRYALDEWEKLFDPYSRA